MELTAEQYLDGQGTPEQRTAFEFKALGVVMLSYELTHNYNHPTLAQAKQMNDDMEGPTRIGQQLARQDPDKTDASVHRANVARANYVGASKALERFA